MQRWVPEGQVEEETGPPVVQEEVDSQIPEPLYLGLV